MSNENKYSARLSLPCLYSRTRSCYTYVGQGALASAASIISAKVLWDTFHLATGRPIRGSISTENALNFTRSFLVCFDSM